MRERKTFLDRLRIAATCAVVLLHTVSGVRDTTDMGLYPIQSRVFLAALDLVCWCVPVFVLISGYLFLDPAREISYGVMLKKYCRRIVLALFLFGVPYALLEQMAAERAFRWNMIGESVLRVLRGESWSHMWYLYLILLLYLLTPPLKWLLARLPRSAVYTLAALLFLGCGILPYVSRLQGRDRLLGLPDDCIYFFYYICGYLFVGKSDDDGKAPAGDETKGRNVQDRLSDGGKRRIPAGCLPGAAALLAAGMAFSRVSGAYTLQMAYNYPFTAALALLLFGWGVTARPADGKGHEKNTVFREQAAALSFGVYLVHPVFLNLAYKFLGVTPLDFPLAVSLPLFFLGTLFLAVLTAWILRKIPPMRKYVL